MSSPRAVEVCRRIREARRSPRLRVDADAAVAVMRLRRRDPEELRDQVEELARAVPLRAAGWRAGLGLDLGTKCGFCLSWFRAGVAFDPAAACTVMGQLDLSAGPYDTGGIRLVRFASYLSAMQPDIVFFEDVRYTPTEAPNRFNANAIVARAATPMEWFGALKGCVAHWCGMRGVPACGYPIGTIKRRASGRGNVGKPEVIAGVNAIFGVDLDTDDHTTSGNDNIADAATCLLLGLEEHARGVA